MSSEYDFDAFTELVHQQKSKIALKYIDSPELRKIDSKLSKFIVDSDSDDSLVESSSDKSDRKLSRNNSNEIKASSSIIPDNRIKSQSNQIDKPHLRTINEFLLETSTTCDLKSAIEQYLATKLWKSLFRIVALIHRRRNYAIVIFSAKKLANSSPHNIRVIDVIPVDNKTKIRDDLTRSSSGAIQPAVLTGEDFTLIQFDPISNPVDSQHPINQSNVKEYRLSFSKIDYLSISLDIDKAKTYPEENEVFTSLNWL